MSQTAETEETAVERKLPVHVGRPLTDLDEAYRLSKNLAVASVLPKDLRGKPSDVLAIVLYGRDLGLSPMQSIQGIYVVKGKPQLSAVTWTALARRAGHKVRWGDCDDKSATVTIVRSDDPDHPHTETFTIEDAVAAGLCAIKDGHVVARSSGGDKLPWETYTRTMLRNRAISTAGKLQCPEVALGFAIEGDYDYIPDEVEVTPPAHHGDVIPAEVEPDQLAADIAAAEADFTDIDDAVVVEEIPAEYVCQTCGVPGVHLSEDCPENAG
jgi:hypothetical protein